ncbi:DUF4385 domain-containing protein [Macrococcus hajekii]|nr:DUF4385 domain-containing protein [Macrococcus hajekii]
MMFNYDLDFDSINFREQPELYDIGRGEQGVLLVQPYKSEILPHWRFKTPEIAQDSAEKIYDLYLNYKKEHDFVGMDMTRKFIQMGYTRAMRYAHHKSGKKYAENGSVYLNNESPEKRESALIFKGYWDKIRADEEYLAMKKEHKEKHSKKR